MSAFGLWLYDQVEREDDVGELAVLAVEVVGERLQNYGLATVADLLSQAFAREVAAVLSAAEVEWRAEA